MCDMTKRNPVGFLSGNLLKIIAMVLMTIDHYAVLFHPYDINWRIPGRLAFPIFAFFIAEGYRYTRNRLRYFLTLAIAGTVFQVVYYLFTGGGMRNIFITLALSLIPVFFFDISKKALLDKTSPLWKKILFPTAFVLVMVALYFGCEKFKPDYRFWGTLVPLFVSLFHTPRGVEVPKWWQTLDILPVHLLCMLPPLILLNHTFGGIQHFSLLALLLLVFYSEKRGKWKMKYFFYIYYPLHLVLLEGLYLLMEFI